MSIVIRNQLEVTLDSLLAETATAKTLYSADSPSLADLGASGEGIARGINVAQAFLDQWTKVMISLSADDRTNEENTFTGFKVKDKSPALILHEAFQAQTNIDIKIDKLRVVERAEHPKPPAHDFVQNVRLPTLELPIFDGQESNWPAFWAAFEHAVHDNKSLTGAQKFTYLMGKLRGPAKGLIEGYAISEANYLSVIELLLKRFGDDERRSAQLQSELFHLPRPSNSYHSLRNFYDNVERICRQLEGMGIDINSNPFLTIALKEKMPNEAKAHLFDREMSSNKKWTPKEWREALGRFVQLKEAIGSSSGDISQPKPAQSTVPLGPQEYHELRRVFPILNEENEGKRADCSLCEEMGHKPSACPQYYSPALIRERLEQQNRCPNCLTTGHFIEQCPSRKRCHQCKDKELHHFLICTSRKQNNHSNSISNPIFNHTKEMEEPSYGKINDTITGAILYQKY